MEGYQSLPEIGMSDPNGTNSPIQSAGGNTKVSPSADAPHAGETVGYGYQSSELKEVGMAPSGENSSGIPAAQSVPIMTFGSPMNADSNFREGQQARHGF